MLQLLSPSWPAGVVTVSVPTVGRFGRWFRWGAGTAVCALAAAGVGCGSGLEGGGGATLRDAGASASSRAATGRRVALVVGNNAYSGQSELYNAVNDARAVASALSEESVGFAVTKLEDATRAELTSALSAFARSLREDDVALFYFAGHGVQVDGINYLMPVDHEGQTEEAVRLDALSAASVEEMLQPARVAMLVFDACRNNPYRGMRGGTGLAPMEARGTLIAYAAGAGQEAEDSAPGASNGLFTSKFVEALRVPGLTAADLFSAGAAGGGHGVERGTVAGGVRRPAVGLRVSAGGGSGRRGVGGSGTGYGGKRGVVAGAGATGDGVLAVDSRQRGRCRLRGVPGAVSERDVHASRAEPAGGAEGGGRCAAAGGGPAATASAR